MGNPLFKASEDGRFDVLRVWKDVTESEVRQVSGVKVLIRLKVRPEVTRPPHRLGGVARSRALLTSRRA